MTTYDPPFPREHPRCKNCQAWKNGTSHPLHDCTPYNHNPRTLDDETSNNTLREAAPDLLVALKAATVELEWLNNNGRIKANAPERHRINARLDVMHAAIAKAEQWT
jgi:hypothetical protein